MTDISDSVAIYKQLDLPESEGNNNNIELLSGNLSQRSTPNVTSMCSSSKHLTCKVIKYNNDNDNTKTNIEYNDTIDEYVETTKKKNKPSPKSSNKHTLNTSSKKHPIPSLSKKKPFTIKPASSLKKTKAKSTKASHSTISSSRSTNILNNPSTSTTKHSKSKKPNLSISNHHNIKKQTINTLKAKSNSVSKSTLSSSYHSKTKQQMNQTHKQSSSSLNKSKQLSQKEFIPSNATTIENPTIEHEQGVTTPLVFSKDESNETSLLTNAQQQRVPIRKNTRKDSYRHSIMVVQEKRLRKEENNKISFNDNEFQIRKKRSTLGEFKDIDEYAVKPQPKLKKSSKKFPTYKPSNKAAVVVVKSENNVNANANADISDVNDQLPEQQGIEVNNSGRKHSTIIEENVEHGSTDKKRKVDDDKFMQLFNEVKGRLQHEKEQLNEERKCKLKRSSSTPLYNTNMHCLNNSSSNYSTEEFNNKKQLINALLKQSITTKHKDDNNNNDEDTKRSISLKHKFKLLKRIGHPNNNYNIINNTKAKSMLLSQLKHKHNNDDVVLSETKTNDNVNVSEYKTFEELKLKAMGTRLMLNDLLINKRFRCYDVETNIDRRKEEKYTKHTNNSTKAKNCQYKGLNLNKLLMFSSFKRNNSQTKVFPPNAMEMSKFNYFSE